MIVRVYEPCYPCNGLGIIPNWADDGRPRQLTCTQCNGTGFGSVKELHEYIKTNDDAPPLAEKVDGERG